MLDSYELAKQEKERIMDNAMLVAYATCAMLGRKEDDISENEAFSLYDRGWIKDRTQRGLLHYSRKGAAIRSAKVYSRFEIESLKRAEKKVTEQFLNAQKTIEKLQTKMDKK